MKDYQIRVVNEKEALDELIKKLHAFIKSDAFNTVLPDEQDRLLNQKDTMVEYSSILGERINEF